ncbi:hypothetical protein [Siminovitchia sp. 179-K 8D1 HS]|uniref:hypothetical protein n=1 Tax=Siminovitchia sp. 179-K 8D1 HS TaxID=3142385 RepID=UPI00399FA9CE
MDKKDKIRKNVNAELGGMGLYGTTSNKNIGGYETSGDIENAGKPDKGFKRPDQEEVQASIKEDDRDQSY